MSKAQAESVIRNIIREIAQECASRGQAVSETLVAFIVKSVVLDPENAFNVDRPLTKEDVHSLIKKCVEKLLDPYSPSLETIKMQVYFDMNYTSRSEFLNEHRRVLQNRLQPVSREITDMRARSRDELETLYRKIVSYVLLRSGLGSPTDIGVVRETTAALQSVFPQVELGTFLSMQRSDKERQLHELTLIVTGIRLFNKDSGKGGEGIDDLPTILSEAIPATSDEVEFELHNILQAVYKYTALIEKQEILKEFEGRSRPQGLPPSPDPTTLPELPIQLLKDAAINIRQYENFLKILMNDIIVIAQKVEDLQSQYTNRMDQLKSVVQSKTAVPTAQVFPQFIHLAQIWTGFQDEMVLLSVLSNIFTALRPFTRLVLELFPPADVGLHLGAWPVKSDEQRIIETSALEYRVNTSDYRALKFEWVFPETTQNFASLRLQYRGFCAMSLIKYGNLLVPGNPSVGILRYEGRLYAFNRADLAYQFLENCDENIKQVGEMAKRSPALIQLLELHHQFAQLTAYGKQKDGMTMERPIMKADCGCQTDTHLVEPYIDRNYDWNEWELRRKAIKLANLRTRLTKSIQTGLSHMRRDNEAQVYLPKDQTVQTLRDNLAQVPKPSTFLFGLRGCGLTKEGAGRQTALTKLDLTLDPDDQVFIRQPHWSDKDKQINCHLNPTFKSR